nr:hypothetical protein [Paenibacillus typhae]
MNDLTRLSLTVTGIRTGQNQKLNEFFVNSLREYLIEEDLSASLISSYIENCNETIITKTDSRSVISTLSEIMLVMKSLEMDNQGFEDMDERQKWNNRFIYKPIDYQKPIEVFIKELKQRYSS